jgi:hypothetical protein
MRKNKAVKINIVAKKGSIDPINRAKKVWYERVGDCECGFVIEFNSHHMGFE